MADYENISNKAEDTQGKAKEALGEAAEDDSLKGEGKLDQAKATAKDKLDNAKDKVNEAIGKVFGNDEKDGSGS